MDEQKRPGAPKGARNRALKEGEEGATSFLHLRCKPSDKAMWVKAAAGQGGLSEWVTTMLNQAAINQRP